MPTLERPAVEDTTVPGLARRRVWSAPAVRSHSLLTLTLSKLYLAPAGMTSDPATADTIQNGADLDDTFGPHATVVLLPTIRRLTLDLPTNALTIDYTRPATSGSGSVPMPGARVVIAFTDYETADEVFSKLWRRLGEGFALRPHKRDPWDVARLPVAAMAGVLIATLTLSLVLSATADAGASGRLTAVASADWRWVCGLGGVVLAGIQVWLYRRLTQPPTRLELAPK